MNDKDDLSLEKLRINDRLHNLELSNARVVSHLESEQGTFQRYADNVQMNIDRLEKMIQRHDNLLLGIDSKGGLLTAVDRLWLLEKVRGWHLKALWTSILGVVSKLIYDLVTKIKQ